MALVLRVDDVEDERDRVVAAGWPLHEELQDRPWRLKDFRILDPAGYYLRITTTAGHGRRVTVSGKVTDPAYMLARIRPDGRCC